MSTQTEQKSSAQFDPTSMGVFQGFQPQFGKAVSSEVTDPYSNMFFNQQLGMQQEAFGAGASARTQALLQRAQALGINPSSPAYFSQLNQLQRQMDSERSGGFNQLLLQAGQLRQGALGMMGAYRPLQTGQTQTQTQSGLGTWLPQVAGMAIKAGTAFATGGASLAADAGSSFFGGGGAGTQMGFTPQSFQGNDPSYWSGQGVFGIPTTSFGMPSNQLQQP
jgi:hypothetical protein